MWSECRERQNSAVLATRTRQSRDSARKRRDRHDLSGGGGTTHQAEVDACVVLREGVGIRMHGGTAKHEESAEWVCAGEA